MSLCATARFTGLRHRAADRVPAIDLEGRAPSLETDLCRHLAIGGELCTTDDPQAGWQMLQAELDAGEPTAGRSCPR